MAFIPDAAVMRAHELPAAAFRMYAYFCMRRSGDTGTCFPSLKRIAAELKMPYTYASTARKTLKDLGWISFDPNGDVRPVMGFEVQQNLKESSTNSKPPSSIKPEGKFNEIETVQQNLNSTKPELSFNEIETIVQQNLNESLTNSELPYIEPAPLTSPSDQPIEPTHAAEPAAEVKGSKQKKGTRIPEDYQPSEETLAWAVANGPDLDITFRLDEFRDYWRSRATNATKTDWDLTFKNRVRACQNHVTDQKKRDERLGQIRQSKPVAAALVGKPVAVPKPPPGPATPAEIAEWAKTAQAMVSPTKSLAAAVDEVDEVNGGWMPHEDANRVRKFLGLPLDSKRLESVNQ